MEISTKYHGDIEITAEQMIHFEQGIPGFEEEKTFILLPFDESDSIFFLQSTVTSQLAFIIVNPFVYFNDYEFELSMEAKQALNVDESSQLLIFTVVTIKGTLETATTNLMAPLVIHIEAQRGMQYIIQDHHYGTKHALFLVPHSK